MSILAPDRARVLVVDGAERQSEFLELFRQYPLAAWAPLPADSFAFARFLLQHHPCNMLVVSSELLAREGDQGLTWLAFQQEAPVVFIGDDDAILYARAYDLGVTTCLSRSLALAHPPLLHSVMQQAVQSWENKAAQLRLQRQLAESCRHVDRLVQMIWRITPRHDDQWYSQRHMLERLQEELARCQRHHVPLSVAVAELQCCEDDKAPALPDWAAASIVRGKRRCDVVGQYGTGGFMLLMVHTNKPGGVNCCQRLQDYLEQPAHDLASPHSPVRSFFGIASMCDEERSPQSLLRIAEQNLEIARWQVEARIAAE